MSWIDDVLNKSRGRKNRNDMHTVVIEWYAALRDRGYDHEESRELMRGVLSVSNPAAIPLAMLWIDREGNNGAVHH